MNAILIFPLFSGLLAILACFFARAEDRRQTERLAFLFVGLLIGFVVTWDAPRPLPLEPGKPYIRSRIIQTP